MGENPLEALLLRVTRDIDAGETGVPRTGEGGIRGLLAEMRAYMLSENGAAPEAQQGVLIRTLRTLMTPALPPFYRIFMGGVVPSYDPTDARVGADPKWLADAFATVREKLPEPLANLARATSWGRGSTRRRGGGGLAMRRWLPRRAGDARRSDGQIGGLVVEKCKFLQNQLQGCASTVPAPAQTLWRARLLQRLAKLRDAGVCGRSARRRRRRRRPDVTEGCIQGHQPRAMKERAAPLSVACASELTRATFVCPH